MLRAAMKRESRGRDSLASSSTFNRIHPTHPQGNHRRMGSWGLPVGHLRLRRNCRCSTPNCHHPNCRSTPSVPVLVVVLDVAPVSLQYVGSWVQSWLVEVPAVWAAAGDVANNNAIEASLIMSKPRSINRLSGDDRGIAPLRTSLITLRLGSVSHIANN